MIIFQLVVNYITGEFDVFSSIKLFARLFIQRRFWTLWYMASLFWLNIAFYFIIKKSKTVKFSFLIVAIMFVIGLLYYHFGGILLPWNIDTILTTILFFFVGYFFKNNYDKIRKYFNKSKSIIYFILFGIVNISFGYLGYHIAGKKMDIYNSSYGFPPLNIVAAFAGIFCVIIFSHWFTIKCIEYIGKNSMIYYAWHQTIMIPIVNVLFGLVGLTSSIIENNCFVLLLIRFTQTVIILLVLTCCHIVISKTKLKFMIGR